MKPNTKQIADPRDSDPYYAEAMAETPEQRDAIIEEMYAAHLKEVRRKEHEASQSMGNENTRPF